jgi:hypothetical protein
MKHLNFRSFPPNNETSHRKTVGSFNHEVESVADCQHSGYTFKNLRQISLPPDSQSVSLISFPVILTANSDYFLKQR